MAAPPPPPAKPILKEAGFMIKHGIITSHGYERVDNARLEKLFHPERHCNQRTLKKFTDEATKLFSRPFFASQLRFYGITFPKSATEAQLRSLLDKAIAAKQCVQVPASVHRTLQELERKYQTELEAWKNVVENWETVWRHQQEEAWAQLETPSERASHDLDRFMEHYFLTHGQPDPAKKPEPLALYGFTDDQVIAEIHGRAAQVPGLEITSAGSGPDRAICVGWDRAAVCGLAGEIENMARERQKKAVQAEWQKAMESHQQFVDRGEPPVLAQASSSQSSAGPALLMARGSFILQCKTITDRFPDLANNIKVALDISDSPANNGETLRAAVELGVFQGTAILAFSQAVMDWFVKHYDKTAVEATGKIYVPSTNSTAKRKFDDESEAERPRKQRKAEEPPPNRIYLRMRGRKAPDGHICSDIQHGHLDFIDSAWSKFKGVLDIPGVGVDVAVEGYRVADKAAVYPPPWSQYWPGVGQNSERGHDLWNDDMMASGARSRS